MENPQVDNQLSIYQRMSDPMAAIEKLGQMFASSGMFGCTKVEQGQVLALACLAESKSPFDLMRNYHIIGGSLSMRSIGMLAEFIKRGGKVKWHSELNSATEAKATFEFGDNKLTEAVYTIKDAEREGLVTGPNKANWAQRPADMLRARLTTKAVRMIAPGIIAGIIDETEIAVPTPAPLLGATVANDVSTIIVGAEARGLQECLRRDSVPEADAVALLQALGSLQEGQSLTDLTPTHVRKIMKNYAAFLTKIAENKANA